uniref:RRM domain-containing protein n=1 Tax=Arion vulgaris TaxID=1028688 RepID=A0A0B6ZNT3_9EUPU
MEDVDQESLRSRSRSPVRRSRSRSPKRSKNGTQRRFTGGRRIVVRNIPYDVKWQDLKDMFRKGVGDVTYVECWRHQRESQRAWQW